MQSGHPNAVFPNLRSVTRDPADPRPNQPGKVDTRRFAGIFPRESPEPVPIDCGDATDEEQHGDSDNLSPLEFVTALEKNGSSVQIASTASTGESSTLSAAQQLVARYRAVHGNIIKLERPTTEINKKELPRIPDDQRSMYTLATPVDPKVTMDMMWRPKPKVHMRHADQLALMQAQCQAIAMMQHAGLKPTDKIQCRRRGCADILSDVQALKYHLHIHNIADAPATYDDASASSCQPSLDECNTTSNRKTPKRAHSRSKSSTETQHKTTTLPRKRSAGSLLPSHPFSRENSQEAPSLSSLTKMFTPGHSPSKPAGPPPARNSKRPATHSRAPPRGRRTRRESSTASVGAGHPSIAMLLSPPSSPVVQGHLVPTPPTNRLMSFVLNPGTDGGNENQVPFPTEDPFSIPEKLTRSRSPLRALSPTRAMSPIRDGIRRILSFGYPTEPTNE